MSAHQLSICTGGIWLPTLLLALLPTCTVRCVVVTSVKAQSPKRHGMVPTKLP